MSPRRQRHGWNWAGHFATTLYDLQQLDGEGLFLVHLGESLKKDDPRKIRRLQRRRDQS
jgi:hypothetical protein